MLYKYFYSLKLNHKLYILSKISRLSKEKILSIFSEKLHYSAEKNKILHKANIIAKNHLLYSKPLAKIFGYKYFYGKKFFTNRFTLDPRPETETIIDTALELSNINSCLDLGTGTGILAITLKILKNHWQIDAIDNNIHCLSTGKKNARYHNVDINFLRKNWLSNWNKSYDLLVTNPPYLDTLNSSIKHDPKYALLGTMKFYEDIAAKKHLFKYIIMEINPQWPIKSLFPGCTEITPDILLIS